MSLLKNDRVLPAIALVIILAFLGYSILNTPDRRDPGQKIGDAISELHNGPDKAARQLENRTPGDKLQDAAHDEKQDIKKSLNQP